MKLKDLGDNIIFDALPSGYDVKKKTILTHLLNIDKQIMPEKMSTIFTTRKIADRFRAYCDSKGYKGLKKDNFVYVEPDTVTEIIINRRRTLQMFFCESADLSGNLVVLIKEDNKLNYVYSGNFVDIRTAILNETFASWVGHASIEYLYLNLKKSGEDHESDDIEQIEQVFNKIQEILEYHLGYGIHIHIPFLGYEYFIHKISERFNNRVALSPKFQAIFINDTDALESLCDSTDKAKIILFPGEPDSKTVRENHKVHKKITINIAMKNMLAFELKPKTYYYELHYSPEPSPFDLQLLTALIKPKRIFGIIDMHNINSKVPKYLIELCGRNENRTHREQRNSLNYSSSTQQSKELSKQIAIGPLAADKVKAGLYLDDSDSD